MQVTRRNAVYGLLGLVWAVVLLWQVQEHARVRDAARSNLSNRSEDIANTVSACIRGMRFRGTVWQERLEPVLNELVNGRTNELIKSSEVLSLVLLNASGEPVASAGQPIDLTQQDLLQKGERWGKRTVTFVNPVDLGARLTGQGATNPTVVLPPWTDRTNAPREARREPPPGPPPPDFGTASETNAPGREGRQRDGEPRSRRPPWFRMPDPEFQALMEKRALHGLVLAMSTESYNAACQRDLWLRAFIAALATVAALGSGLAWRSLTTSSELQIRLVRASEMNARLKEMNLAAAGLAHETRNPLNIIRGLAQMISREAETAAETKANAREIVEEADKLAAQLNEFINYSKPRQVRPAVVSLGRVTREVARALSYDLEEKKIQLDIQGEALSIQADEQLLRQTLFNLLFNAIQAVDAGGQIQVAAARRDSAEAVLEVRDNGPGVPPENRTEIFKPYFTTQKQGTGLGLAVVQQIVLAHGWEIECLSNQPRGAIFRLTHVKLADAPLKELPA